MPTGRRFLTRILGLTAQTDDSLDANRGSSIMLLLILSRYLTTTCGSSSATRGRVRLLSTLSLVVSSLTLPKSQPPLPSMDPRHRTTTKAATTSTAPRTMHLRHQGTPLVATTTLMLTGQGPLLRRKFRSMYFRASRQSTGNAQSLPSDSCTAMGARR